MDAGLERRLLVFIKQDHYLKLCERTLSFAVSLRKKGEVALMESPYELGATARISSSLTEVKQKIGRRNRALRGSETRTPDAKTKTSGQLSTQSFPRSLKSRVFKVGDRDGSIASTRRACAPQKTTATDTDRRRR